MVDGIEYLDEQYPGTPGNQVPEGRLNIADAQEVRQDHDQTSMPGAPTKRASNCGQVSGSTDGRCPKCCHQSLHQASTVQVSKWRREAVRETRGRYMVAGRQRDVRQTT